MDGRPGPYDLGARGVPQFAQDLRRDQDLSVQAREDVDAVDEDEVIER
jgi:hypothetical protein